MNVAIINRGISGSGKSTFIKLLTEKAAKHNQKVVTHSTDNLFMVNGEYQFDVKKLGYNHKQNYENFIQSIKDKINIVICDNTNSKQWEYKPYAVSAKLRGYKIISVFFFPDKIDLHLKRNTHSLTREILERQKKNLLNNIETAFVDEEYKITPATFFDDIDYVSQAILGKNIF